MASLNQERFTPATDDTNYERTEKWCQKYQVRKTWCRGKCIALETEEEELAELNRLHEKFNAKI